MKSCVVIVAMLCAIGSTAVGQSTAFTYQGRLNDGGNPASGRHDFRFTLFNAASGGSQVGTTQCADNLMVGEGYFTTTIDFGQRFATTSDRFLEIEVRKDTGQGCGNANGFMKLNPRQAITATPWASHAKSAFSLDASDGNPSAAVDVDADGNVGIGTATPSMPLHVASDVFPVIVVQDTGDNSTQAGYLGFLNGTGTETGWVGFGSPDSPHLSIFNARGGGNIALLPTSGRVGIGTSSPLAMLDVRGDIRLGFGGEFRATAGEENLRIIRGRVSAAGGHSGGSGFTVVRTELGRYTVTFTNEFADVPTVTATTTWDINLSDIIAIAHVGRGEVAFAVTNPVVEDRVDTPFHFTAIGLR